MKTKSKQKKLNRLAGQMYKTSPEKLHRLEKRIKTLEVSKIK